MWIVFLMYALFATIFPVGKIAMGFAPAFALTGVRMLLAGAILFVYLLIKRPHVLRFTKDTWALLLGIGFFNVFITNAFEFWGLFRMGAAETSLIYSLSPLASIIFSRLIVAEKMSKDKWIGLSVGMCGMFFVFSKDELGFWHFSTAQIAVAIAATTAVIGWSLFKRLLKQGPFNFIAINSYSFFIGGLFSLATSYSIQEEVHWQNFWVLENVEILCYIALIHNVLCYNLYAWSLTKFSINFMTFAGFSSPIVAAFSSWLLLGEQVGWTFYVALTLIAVGLALFAKAERKEIALVN